jgi:hypothetical protein
MSLWKKAIIIVGTIFVLGSLLNAAGRIKARAISQAKEQQSLRERATPVATDEATPDRAHPLGVPVAVSDQRDPLEFGKPTVKTERSIGMTTVMVKAKNVAGRPITCTITATFMRADTILGVAMGTTNEHPVGASRTVTMISTDSIKGYDTVNLEATTCF